MYFVYIIETEDGTYYTGQTNNLLRRLKEHVSGKSHSAAYFRMHPPLRNAGAVSWHSSVSA
jgi:putative endonuclease